MANTREDKSHLYKVTISSAIVSTRWDDASSRNDVRLIRILYHPFRPATQNECVYRPNVCWRQVDIKEERHLVITKLLLFSIYLFIVVVKREMLAGKENCIGVKHNNR